MSERSRKVRVRFYSVVGKQERFKGKLCIEGRVHVRTWELLLSAGRTM